MKINIASITGYASTDKKICVKNNKGNTLYYMENPEGNNITFNLIPGKWVTNNNLVKLPAPLVYSCPPLAPAEIKRKLKPFKIRYGNNPSKCTIDFSKPNYVDVFFDNEFKSQAIPFITFILFHEQGHFRYGGWDKDKDPDKYYAAETKCDIYAVNKMLKKGFNPSQCIFAIELCLSELPEARERKDAIAEYLKDVTVNEPEMLEHVEKTVEKTNYTIERHGEKTPVVQFVVNGPSDMTGKTYILKNNTPIYTIEGNQLTERAARHSGDSDEFKVEKVLAVENQILHPSTWSQGTNIFLVNDKGEYVYFGSADNWLNIAHILKHDVIKGADKIKAQADETAYRLLKFVSVILITAFLGLVLEQVLIKKLSA